MKSAVKDMEIVCSTSSSIKAAVVLRLRVSIWFIELAAVFVLFMIVCLLIIDTLSPVAIVLVGKKPSW